MYRCVIAPSMCGEKRVGEIIWAGGFVQFGSVFFFHRQLL